jgi:UDP-glucose 4-epimerase
VTAGYREFYRGRKVMITGGLGFIGSNLARQLVELGADVLLVDSLIPDYAATCSTSTASPIASTSTSPTCASRRR